MRFITIEIGCDWTDCDVRHPEGSDEFLDVTIAVNKKAPRRLTLCLKHHDALHDILDPVLARGTTEPVEKPARPSRAKSAGETPETVPSHVGLHCKVPGCGQPVKGNVGLAQHLKKKHDGMTREEHELLPEPEKT